ncbi:MAG: hypothetical protein ACK5RV_11210 [Flavobacterium sp.]|jgi:hypothetical protein|uniref:hypothetical protein n=1 Tax=Flavobacterium sp. TaxID=239 RepID=UPI0022C47630|nr:hypothetical protein [Flavobacterium sp.]MCZ8169673.1 hypothetical protein [Flavobacterium sp.]MCZ8297971.1 hypothetical protein [Flavobacterium sp.]
MKKLVFGLIATLAIGFAVNAQESSLTLNEKEPYILYAVNDLNHLEPFKSELLTIENLRPKNGWYYAGVDAGGAWGWGSAGAALGPLGASAGAVLGGLCTTTWAFHWENRMAPKPVKHPSDDFVNSFTNENERCGYLHNKFAEKFINENQAVYTNANDFLAKFYDPLCEMVASEYNIKLSDLKKAFPKEALRAYIDQYTELASYTDDYKTIIQMGEIVKSKSGNEKCSDYYVKVMQSLYSQSESISFKIEPFIENEIENVILSKKFTDEEKNSLRNSLNVLKYSYALWSAN